MKMKGKNESGEGKRRKTPKTFAGGGGFPSVIGRVKIISKVGRLPNK